MIERTPIESLSERFDQAVVAEMRNDLAQFYGTESYAKVQGANRMTMFMTDGVQYVVDKCKCKWLIAFIYTYQRFLTKRQQEDMQCWTVKLDSEGTGATIKCTDGNYKQIHTQKIPFTDFPLPEIEIWIEVGGDERGNLFQTLLLPSEH